MIKYSLITGSAGLLGRQHATALLELNYNIVITDIDNEGLEKTYIYLKKLHPTKKIIKSLMDVTSSKSIEKNIKNLRRKKIIINNLINNAAIDSKVDKKNKKKNNQFENFDLNIWNKEIQVGLTGAMLCSKIIGRDML